ncbi:MAG: hypothetical protein V2B20_06260 [Pseudomonadota bacterium]
MKSIIIRNWKLITSLIVGLWAFYTFVYSQIYIPYTEKTFLAVSAELIQKGKIINDGVEIIPIILTITAKNNSKKRLSVVSAFTQVWGDKIKKIETVENTKVAKAIETVIDSYNSETGKYNVTKESCMLYVAPIFKNWDFDPGESKTEVKIFYLPNDSANILEANVNILSGPMVPDFDFKHIVNEDMTITYPSELIKNVAELKLSKNTVKTHLVVNKARGQESQAAGFVFCTINECTGLPVGYIVKEKIRGQKISTKAGGRSCNFHN